MADRSINLLSLADSCHQLLKHHGQTISFAESCTGGLLAATLTQIPGASSIFPGSLVVYSEKIKTSLAQVSETLIQTQGVYSPKVAFEMATGVRQVMKTTWGLSTTGIAGPDGGTDKFPVGFVSIAIDGPLSKKNPFI